MRTLVACAVLALAVGSAGAQPCKDNRERHGIQPECSRPVKAAKPAKVPIFDMPAMGIDAKARMASMLYFLERANEELERASLERRSFIPDMVRTIDEEAL